MIWFLRILFSVILVVMLVATTITSMTQNIVDIFAIVPNEPWWIMTLYDTYFAFLTFFVWVAYKEKSYISKFVWFILIMLLGNIAMAGYVLIELFKIKPDGKIEDVLLRKIA